MTRKPIILSSRGLKNIVCDDITFTFEVNGREFNVSRFKAQFISGAVSRQLHSDPTQTSFSISIVIDNSSHKTNQLVWNMFENIISLCDGNSISLDISLFPILRSICEILENEELFETIISDVPVSESNVIFRLAISMTDSDISFGCEHFDSLDHSRLSEFPSVVLCLLSDSRLRIESEDRLLEIIELIIDQNESLRFILDFIEARFLSCGGISRFISLLSHESLSYSNWSSLVQRLLLPVSPLDHNPRLRSGSGDKIELDRLHPFEGIFAHLWGECHSNPHKAGLIHITANDERQDRKFECYDLISPESKTGKWWGTGKDTIDHFVKIDFKNHQICPSGYSVRTHNPSWGCGWFLKSWRFEGSNNDSEWFVLDNRTNCSELQGNDREASFEFSPISSTSFRFVRLIMIGMNSGNTHELSLQRFEIFGKLIKPDS
jgi:hypothetical protein